MKVVAKPGAKSIIGWLDSEKVLTVLAISSNRTEGSEFLIWSEPNDSAALFPASDFMIKDGSLPPIWVATIDANGFVFLAPREWQVDGFWERYHDGEASAESAFMDGMTSILGE